MTEATGRVDRIGGAVTLASLGDDPYPLYERLRQHEPISWVGQLGMWFVTRYADVRLILRETQLFTTAWPESLIFRTFGEHMLTTDGPAHDRHRAPFRQEYMPAAIRDYEPLIRAQVRALIEPLRAAGRAEFRKAFASKLPIRVMLSFYGISLEHETRLRQWYDLFEESLANFSGDPQVEAAAVAAAESFRIFLARELASAAPGTPLGGLRGPQGEGGLAANDLVRNLSIIFFGGISTVEALLLNALWVLATEPALARRVRSDLSLLEPFLNETMRWAGPVQSATRHVTRDIEWKDVPLRAGDTLNCMIAAANHDPAVFPDPAKFDIDRPNLKAHLGFAAGPHMCLGFRLAMAEARLALEEILPSLGPLAIDPTASAAPSGHEFRQPRALTLVWGAT